MGMGWDWNGKEVMEMGGNGNENTVPAHLYYWYRFQDSYSACNIFII